MLDSEPTDPTNTTTNTVGADGDAASAPAPRKRAPRKATKAAAAGATDGATAPGEPAAVAAGTYAAATDGVPAKAVRRSRRATAPAGNTAPAGSTAPTGDTGASTDQPTGDAAPAMAAAGEPTASRPRRTRATRPTKSAPIASPQTESNPTESARSVAAVGTDSLTDATAAAPAPRRRTRGSSTTAAAGSAAVTENSAQDTSADRTPVGETSGDQAAATTVRAPRKRAARKTAAPVADETSAGTDGTQLTRPSAPSFTEAAPAPDAAPTGRPAVPVLFVAPGTADAADDAPPARRRRRATSGVSTPGSTPDTGDAPAGEREAASTATHDADTVRSDRTDSDRTDSDRTDADGAGSGEDDPRRRRRRGRRGRGARSEDDTAADDGATNDGAQNDGRAGESSDDDSDGDGDADSESDGVGSRRRRRRRRGSGSGDGADARNDDPPNTVVHVRTPRGSTTARASGGSGSASTGNGDDEVRGIRGSSRLEAKRQRRREGRDNGRRRVPILSEAEFLARRESVDRLMAVRQRGDRTQIAILEDGVLVEHYVTRASATSYVGNVYLGRVQNVLPSMEAAFVDIGKGRNGVLYAGEVNWDAAGLEGKARAIEAAMKSGDAVLVQVTKDPIGHKGARLTSQISLPGRFLVLVPNGGMTGISRKLPDTERHRLKAILKKIVPEDAGVIVRTAAEGASEEDLTSDMDRLKAQWEAISAHAAKPADAPALVHGEPDLAIRVVRDVFNEDFQSMVVEGDDAWSQIADYLGSVAPELAARASRHTSGTDLFHELRVDEQLAKALDRKVWLPSGGSLVIDRTEAMVVIDVNTGKFTGSGGNLEQTVTRNNLEAAEEIVRQLRLRDVGGIIVIDFIDMVLESNRDLVLRRLTECLGRDRTKHQVAEVTSLGLVQMTRKRVGEGLLEAFSEQCDKCHGRGVIVHSEPIDQAHRHDVDDGPSRGSGNDSGNGGSGNGGSGNGGSGSGGGSSSGRRGRRGRGGGQRDDAPLVEERDDDPERRARAAAAMNAIARHTLAVEAEAAAQTDADEMPEAALSLDNLDSANGVEPADWTGADGDGEALAEAEVREDVAAALDELPDDIISAALDGSADDGEFGLIGGELIDFEAESPNDADSPNDTETAYEAGPNDSVSGESGPNDSVSRESVPNDAAPSDSGPSNGRPRRRRAARRPAGPPVHV